MKRKMKKRDGIKDVFEIIIEVFVNIYQMLFRLQVMGPLHIIQLILLTKRRRLHHYSPF